MNPATPGLAALEALVRSAAQEELVARFRRTARQEKTDTLDGRPAPLTLTPRSALCAADPQLFWDWRTWLRAG